MEEEENDDESVLGLLIPLVSIVITQPTPEIERRTLEGWIEEEEEDEDDGEDLIAGDNEEKKEEEDKENIEPDSKAGNEKSIRVGANKEHGEVPAIIVTPVTPELSQKMIGGEEIESDQREEEREEITKATAVEKSQVKSGISFNKDVKAEEEEDGKDGEKGEARVKRRSSLFATVTKATSILR